MPKTTTEVFSFCGGFSAFHLPFIFYTLRRGQPLHILLSPHRAAGFAGRLGAVPYDIRVFL